MAAVHLDTRSAELLYAVAAGRVARHRLRRTDSPENGVDYERVAGHGPGGLRKAWARLRPLLIKQLIVLDRQALDAETWPWKTTELGDSVMEILTAQKAGMEAAPVESSSEEPL